MQEKFEHYGTFEDANKLSMEAFQVLFAGQVRQAKAMAMLLHVIAVRCNYHQVFLLAGFKHDTGSNVHTSCMHIVLSHQHAAWQSPACELWQRTQPVLYRHT